MVRPVISSFSLLMSLIKYFVNSRLQGPVVRRTISANPGLNFNQSFSFFCSKALSCIILYLLFRATNHQIVVKKNKTEFAFYAFISEFKFGTNPRLS